MADTPKVCVCGNTVGHSVPQSDYDQEDTRHASYIKNKPKEKLPVVTSDDNGKFLRVIDGSWGLADLARAEATKF